MSENTNNPPVMIKVNMGALGQLLRAINGPGHLIRELQVTRDSVFSDTNPINILLKQYNEEVERVNEQKLFARLITEVTPYDGEICEGCVVKATGDYILHCGSGVYPDAVVISMEPFLLTSRETDMRWSCFPKENLVVVGKASDEFLAYCKKRRLEK